METGERGIRRHLVLEEIEHIVAEAKAAGRVLRTGYHAGMIASRYPDAFSIGRIIDELILAASRAGVAVEIGRDPGYPKVAGGA
jgi:hypothetical protein